MMEEAGKKAEIQSICSPGYYVKEKVAAGLWV
jgi:hypothetical protein